MVGECPRGVDAKHYSSDHPISLVDIGGPACVSTDLVFP